MCALINVEAIGVGEWTCVYYGVWTVGGEGHFERYGHGREKVEERGACDETRSRECISGPEKNGRGKGRRQYRIDK